MVAHSISTIWACSALPDLWRGPWFSSLIPDFVQPLQSFQDFPRIDFFLEYASLSASKTIHAFACTHTMRVTKDSVSNHEFGHGQPI